MEPTEWILVAGTVFVLGVTLLPISRHTHWLVRIWEFPRVQITLITLGLLLVTLSLADLDQLTFRIVVGVLVIVMAWHLWWIGPYTPLHRHEVRQKRVDETERGTTLRLMTANVLMDNRRTERFIFLVNQWQPDILVTLETDDRWERDLTVLEKSMPHCLRCPLDNRYGMHLYSRVPLIDPRIEFLVEPDVPSFHMRVRPWPGHEPIRIHFVHPAPPSPTENEESLERDGELLTVARSLEGYDGPALVAGDLNDVAWSHTTRLFRKISRMRDPRIGRGMFNTFNAKWPMIRFPLDHVFLSHHFALVEMRRLPGFGSDHFAIFIEVAPTMKTAPEHTLEPATSEDRLLADDCIEESDARADRLAGF